MAAIEVVDVRTDMRLQRFDGTGEKWGDWSLRFEAYTALPGFEEFMAAADQRQDPLLNDQLDERARQVSQRLWHLLTTYCEGKAMGVVKLLRKSGLEDKWAKDREAGVDFFQSLTASEAIVAEYVDQSGEAVSDNVKVSVLLEHAPDPYREVLRQAPEEVKLTFGAARSHIRGYYKQGRTSTHVPDVGGVVPMQVDAVRARLPNGMASGEGKTHKSDKSGGTSGRSQKGKDSKTQSNGRDGGKHGNNQPEVFDGECGYCGKWGHKRADCRKKADDSKKEPGHTPAVQGDAASPSGQQPADGTVKAASGYYDGKPDGWVFAVTAQTDGKVAKVGGSILVDSGSDDHLCRRRFVPEAPISAAVDAPRLFDVQQRPLPTAGLRGAEMTMKEGITATADFLVADVNDDLLSMGELLRQGFRFNHSLEDWLYMTKGHRSVQLTLERNSLRFPIVAAGPAAEAHRCLGAAERQDAATAPVLNADSSVGAMRARLRKLCVPIYGAKAELWDRPIVAEAAVRRSEAERARKQAVTEQLGCEECTRGKTPDTPRTHVALEDSERKAPLISFDFGFCKTADEGGGLAKVEGAYATMPVAFSSDAGVVKVIPCPSKSALPCAIEGIKQFAQRLETGKCRLRTDSEPASKAILDGVVAELTGKVIPELTPTHSSQSNPAEAAAKIAAGQTRVLRLDLGKRYGTKITAAMPIRAWMMRHAGWLHERYSRRAGGQSPHEMATGTPCKGDLCNFGEAAERRGLPPEAGASESMRARVAAVHELGVGDIDDPPDAFWEGISDEVEDPTEVMFDVDGQGELDKKLTLEHLQSLLDHGVGEDIPKSEARGMKRIAARWEKQWRWKPARLEWQRKVRFVCREFRWQEWRDDLFTPGSAPISNRLIDFAALKRGFEVMALDATGAFYRAPEHEDVVVDPPQEYLGRLQAEGKSTDIYWKLKRQLPGRRTAAPGWVEHMAGTLMGEMRMARCEVAPQFFYNSETEVVVELHMCDLRMAGPRGALEGFRDELGQRVTFSGGEIHEHGATCEHLEGLRARFEHGAELRANPKYLDYVVETLGLGGANTAGMCRSCVGALMYCAHDRADCQCQVSLLGRMPSGPTAGAFTALKWLARYLMGTRGAVNWPPRPTEGTNVELVGYGDSDWGIVATSSGVAEYYAATAVAEDLLYFKSLLEFMGFTVAATLLTDSSAARGIAKREKVGKVRSLEARVLWAQQAIKRKLMDLGTVGTDNNQADLGTNTIGYERFVKLRTMNGIYTDMGQVAESDHQSEEMDFEVGAAARVRRAPGAAASPNVTRSAPLAMITAAVALLQGCEGPATEYDGYCDAEVCSKDGAVVSDWTNYWLVLVVWTLVVATVFGYAGFRYASWGEQEWLLVQTQPGDAKDKKIDSGIGCMSSTSTKSTVDQSNRMRRTVGTQPQTTYKWRWATPRFQPLSISMHGAFLEAGPGVPLLTSDRQCAAQWAVVQIYCCRLMRINTDSLDNSDSNGSGAAESPCGESASQIQSAELDLRGEWLAGASGAGAPLLLFPCAKASVRDDKKKAERGLPKLPAGGSGPAGGARRPPAVGARAGGVAPSTSTRRQAPPAKACAWMGLRRGLALVAEALGDSSCLVVSGGTGSGKSTQIPQYLVDDFRPEGLGGPTDAASPKGDSGARWAEAPSSAASTADGTASEGPLSWARSARVVVTEPRRIAAIALAERVAFERGEPVGRSVGYSVRGDSSPPNRGLRGGTMEFCTVGILLRRLQRDPLLKEVSHVLVDEVHERDLMTDFLLILLKELLCVRSDLRVVLMSATLDVHTFTGYFWGCPCLEIPTGPRYEVQEVPGRFCKFSRPLLERARNAGPVEEPLDRRERSGSRKESPVKKKGKKSPEKKGKKSPEKGKKSPAKSRKLKARKSPAKSRSRSKTPPPAKVSRRSRSVRKAGVRTRSRSRRRSQSRRRLLGTILADSSAAAAPGDEDDDVPPPPAPRPADARGSRSLDAFTYAGSFGLWVFANVVLSHCSRCRDKLEVSRGVQSLQAPVDKEAPARAQEPAAERPPAEPDAERPRTGWDVQGPDPAGQRMVHEIVTAAASFANQLAASAIGGWAVRPDAPPCPACVCEPRLTCGACPGPAAAPVCPAVTCDCKGLECPACEAGQQRPGLSLSAALGSRLAAAAGFAAGAVWTRGCRRGARQPGLRPGLAALEEAPTGRGAGTMAAAAAAARLSLDIPEPQVAVNFDEDPNFRLEADALGNVLAAAPAEPGAAAAAAGLAADWRFADTAYEKFAETEQKTAAITMKQQRPCQEEEDKRRGHKDKDKNNKDKDKRRRAKTEALVEGAVASLNAMARCQPGRVLRAEEPRRLFDADIAPVQDAMLCNVARAAKQFVPAPVVAEEFPEGALAELAQCKSIYDLDGNSAQADYDPSKLKVLERASVPLGALDVAGDECRRYLEDPDNLIVLPPDELASVDAPVKAHWDKQFARPGAARREFIRRLDKVGLVAWRLRARAECGAFFVKKKEGMDLKGGFYQFRVGSVASWFSLGESFTAAEAGVTSVYSDEKACFVEMRRVVGHLVDHFSARRELLSCFCFVYRFIGDGAGPARRLDTATLEELRIIQGLLPLAVVELGRRELLGALPGGPEAVLEGALTDFARDYLLRDVADARARCVPERQPLVEVVGRVPTLSASWGDPRRWEAVVIGKWRKPDKIRNLEARAAIMGLQEYCGDPDHHSSVVLSLGDNMPEVLAIGRGRSRTWDLLPLVRRAGAWQVAANVRWARRHIETRSNPSDYGSRLPHLRPGEVRRGVAARQLGAGRPRAALCGAPGQLALSALGTPARGPDPLEREPPGRLRDRPPREPSDRRPPRQQQYFLELFAGCMRLTACVAALGLAVAVPVDLELGLVVAAATRKRYEQCYAAVAHAVGRLPKKDDYDAWGRIMVDYVEDLYRAGDAATAARYAFHGVAFVNDWPRRSPDPLPKTRLSILAFARSSPEHCRDPPAVELVLLVLDHFLDRAVGEDCLRMALVAAHGAISFDCYLRPSEGWAITVAPAGIDAKPAKNRRFDASVLVGAHDRMLKLPDLEKEYRAASAALGFRAIPHGLRHAGPSHDAVVHKVKIEGVQARGRWASLESCRIYTKPATLVRSLNAVSDDLLDRAGALKATFSRRLLSVLREGLGVPPSRGWTIAVAPAGIDAKPAKNRRFDASVLVGAHDRQWVCEVLELLAADLQPNDRVFRMLKLPDLEKEYRAASAALGFRAIPHGLRHAGPSHDAVVHKVKIEGVQARGRWASLESCRIYTKPATLVRSLNAVSDDLLDRAGALKATFSRRLLSVLREGLGAPPSRGGLKRRRGVTIVSSDSWRIVLTCSFCLEVSTLSATLGVPGCDEALLPGRARGCREALERPAQMFESRIPEPVYSQRPAAADAGAAPAGDAAAVSVALPGGLQLSPQGQVVPAAGTPAAQPAAPVLPLGHTVKQVQVKQSCVGYIIGKGGETLKGIQAQSGATVHIDQSTKDLGYSLVRLTGPEQAVAAAEAFVTNKVAEVEREKSARESTSSEPQIAAADAAYELRMDRAELRRLHPGQGRRAGQADQDPDGGQHQHRPEHEGPEQGYSVARIQQGLGADSARALLESRRSSRPGRRRSSTRSPSAATRSSYRSPWSAS
ncbi:unnamed protein product [Prorocentrum cordatum]|uniref:Uncharacterized protein n=1 Tax=Prorocentrum cordatum TaxID=2364126 RepID=A0ABN9QQA7_9DINO|nr:unnamed protein product [Polarella glacialis]